MKNKNLTLAVILIAICTVLILAILFIPKIVNKNKMEKLAEKYMETGNYSEAIDIYNKLIEKTNDDEYVDKLEKGKKLLNSTENFNEGKKEFEKGNYEKSVLKLKEVSKDDTKNYKNAGKLIEDIKTIYIEKISKSVENNKTFDTESQIAEYVKIFGNDENIKALKEKVDLNIEEEKKKKEKEELDAKKEQLEKMEKELENKKKEKKSEKNNEITSGNYVVSDKANIYSIPDSKSKAITWVSKGATVDIYESEEYNGELWIKGRITSIVTNNSYVAWIRGEDIN